MPTHQRWALARRSISKPDEIAYYLAYAPLGTTIESLAVLAHAFLAVMAVDAAAKGAAETVPASRPSPWQKFGGSWQLATHPSPFTNPSSAHAH
ncbi:hypothetical protein AB5J52_47265 [Streptomyces sp. R39]|uniref:Uncharacterized protein n=1 Tax=Streptomyces sp. R39 TaxID=3238631 RepID=A0AB39R6B7_9ACTN